MPGYYRERLAGERLRACYDLAPPRVQAYLEAEVEFVLAALAALPRPAAVLELGCGYGRVLRRLVPHARAVVGIDTALRSLEMARTWVGPGPTLQLAAMDASCLGFRDGVFDLVVCIQNGISAFQIDPRQLLAEAVRATRPGGTVLMSSYAPRFWPDRLEWFELQAARGLVGPIDRAATGDGVIVCEDGFRATTTTAAEFSRLAASLRLDATITEVDGSSLFCEIRVP
jgi:2-polyprenyl-6-hydroxyphenyl methylase/3-demethylubiquinone-9 3-methyltransferase